MIDSLPGWDPFQREVLDALGHVVYVPRDGAPGSPVVVASPSDPAAASAPPLLRALARAANVQIAALPALPAIEQLRLPAAKRALWPQLRALRKASRA